MPDFLNLFGDSLSFGAPRKHKKRASSTRRRSYKRRTIRKSKYVATRKTVIVRGRARRVYMKSGKEYYRTKSGRHVRVKRHHKTSSALVKHRKSSLKFGAAHAKKRRVCSRKPKCPKRCRARSVRRCRKPAQRTRFGCACGANDMSFGDAHGMAELNMMFSPVMSF